MNARTPIDPAVLAEAERWFAEMMAPEAGIGLQAGFVAWLQADPAHRQAYRQVERLWERLDEAVHTPAVLALHEAAPPGAASRPAPPHPELAALAFRVRTPPSPQRRWRRRSATGGLAACLLLAVGVVSLWRPSPPAQVLQSAVGESRSVTLADGSVVTLDTDSRISVAIDTRHRRIVLEHGAAFFDVAPDAARPFEVATRTGSARVLGTQFQVRHTDGAMHVLLVKGALRLNGAAGDAVGDTAGVTLKPGQQAVRTAHAPWQVAAADPAATAWREGRLVFRDTPLPQAVDEVNRYTLRRLRIGDAALQSLTVSGVFRIGDPDSFVLVLENSLPVRSRPEGDGRLLLQE